MLVGDVRGQWRKARARLGHLLGVTAIPDVTPAETQRRFADRSGAAERIEDELARLPDKSVDVIVTDPPYSGHVHANLCSGSLVGTKAVPKYELADKTLLGRTALIAPGATALAMFAPIVFAMAPVIAAATALYLAFDDVFTMFQGGNSLIGDFIDTFFGKGAARMSACALRRSAYRPRHAGGQPLALR